MVAGVVRAGQASSRDELAPAETRLPRHSTTQHPVHVEDEATIDELILAERIIPALQAIMAELGRSLSEALDEFQQRYDRLRTERPDDFTLSPEEYGRNFHS